MQTKERLKCLYHVTGFDLASFISWKQATDRKVLLLLEVKYSRVSSLFLFTWHWKGKLGPRHCVSHNEENNTVWTAHLARCNVSVCGWRRRSSGLWGGRATGRSAHCLASVWPETSCCWRPSRRAPAERQRTHTEHTKTLSFYSFTTVNVIYESRQTKNLGHMICDQKNFCVQRIILKLLFLMSEKAVICELRASDGDFRPTLFQFLLLYLYQNQALMDSKGTYMTA